MIQLIARLESPITGDVLLDELQAKIPRDRLRTARAPPRGSWVTAVAEKMPFAKGVQPLSNDPFELLINTHLARDARRDRRRRAAAGADGRQRALAGNRAQTVAAAAADLRCRARRTGGEARARARSALRCAGGVCSPRRPRPAGTRRLLHPGSSESISRASRGDLRPDAVHIGCGGTIPFMGMLGERFPETQFFITGVLGPHANAHGPNEFLHIDYTRRLTACVALVLADFAARTR